MLLWCRLFVIWALVLAVPFQGYAIAKGCCAHHDTPTPSDLLVEGNATLGLDKIEKGDSASRVASAESASGEPQPAGLSVIKQSKCSACASCCSSNGPLPEPLHLPVVTPSTSTFLSISIDAPTYLTSGQERPPKSFSSARV